MSKISKIAVITSGGDAPGMNAAIRAVVRTGIYNGLEVYGVKYGYRGLIYDDIFKMDTKSVANIIQRGGTVLKTARSKEFYEKEGRAKAYKNVKKHGIDGIIIIGGDGSFKGALAFSQEYDIPCIGLPGTIDKDMSGTDLTIGFDTAVNTAVDAIDKIRDTADAHDRLFIVEVMGRDAGYIALNSGISSGAEHILVPEKETNAEDIIDSLKANQRRQKLVNIIIVAEGVVSSCNATQLTQIIKEKAPKYDTRLCILGHIQRGGSPTYTDRLLASELGFAAVESLIKEQKSYMIGRINNELKYTPLKEATKASKGISEKWFRLANILAS
ncbi:MAG TPA: 6-phosphofructokinase [Chitinophagaceae bacterium]|nr:6-phosphofructokinase [Chitinophagaceae bacterium]